MKKLNHIYGLALMTLIAIVSSCGLDNHKSEKEKQEDIRQGGNNVDYKDAKENGSPSLSDTTRKSGHSDSTKVRYNDGK